MTKYDENTKKASQKRNKTLCSWHQCTCANQIFFVLHCSWMTAFMHRSAWVQKRNQEWETERKMNMIILVNKMTSVLNSLKSRSPFHLTGRERKKARQENAQRLYWTEAINAKANKYNVKCWLMHAILPLSFCALRCLNSSLILYTYFGSVFKFLRFEHVRHQLSSTEFFIKKTFLGQSKYSIRYCIPQLPIKNGEYPFRNSKIWSQMVWRMPLHFARFMEPKCFSTD